MKKVLNVSNYSWEHSNTTQYLNIKYTRPKLGRPPLISIKLYSQLTLESLTSQKKLLELR
jgi:hypothetical protein